MRLWTRGCLAFVLCASAALGDDGEATRAEARAVYDQGTQAFDHGDFEGAARAFARADELVPSPTALRAALDAAVDANDAVLAMTLVGRASGRASDPALGASIEKARARFAGATGTLVPACTAPCTVHVDGGHGADRALVVRAGEHTVRVDARGERAERSVQVPPDSRVTLALAPSRRFSPVWLGLGAGATVAGALVTTIFGIDTLHQHDQFVASGCLHSPSCDAIAQRGLDAQLRTNVALGVTIGLAALTLVALWLFTRSHGPAVVAAVAP